MNGNSSKRIAVIDIAKGIGILLVIAGHILPRESAAFLFIYSFHMPLFFILIGIVTDISGQTGFKAFLAADKKLMVSYVFWSLAFFVFDAVVRCLLQGYIGLSGLFWDVWQTMVLFGINVLWFLPTAALAKMTAGWIYRIGKSPLCRLAVGSALFICVSMVSTPIGKLNWAGMRQLVYYPLIAVMRAVSMSVYILLGMTVSGKVKGYLQKAGVVKTACCTAVSIILLLLLFRCAGEIDIHIMRMGNWYAAVLCAVLGTAAVLGISILADKSGGPGRFLQFLGNHSLFIMATHNYFEIREGIVEQLLFKLGLLPAAVISLEFLCMVGIEWILCVCCAPVTDKIIRKMAAKI